MNDEIRQHFNELIDFLEKAEPASYSDTDLPGLFNKQTLEMIIELRERTAHLEGETRSQVSHLEGELRDQVSRVEGELRYQVAHLEDKLQALNTHLEGEMYKANRDTSFAKKSAVISIILAAASLFVSLLPYILSVLHSL